LRTLHPKLNIGNMPLLIFVNKGIEIGSHALTLEIITDTCGPEIAKAATFIVSLISCTWRRLSRDIVTQSGPSFAKESEYFLAARWRPPPLLIIYYFISC
jgi:hypothetical protein